MARFMRLEVINTQAVKDKEYDNLSDSSINYDKCRVNLNDTTTNMDSNSTFINKNEKYDPSLIDQICCVELINNNKIYISYDISWTIKDVNILNI